MSTPVQLPALIDPNFELYLRDHPQAPASLLFEAKAIVFDKKKWENTRGVWATHCTEGINGRWVVTCLIGKEYFQEIIKLECLRQLIFVRAHPESVSPSAV